MRSNVNTTAVTVTFGFDRQGVNTRTDVALRVRIPHRIHASARQPQGECARGSYRGSSMSPSRCGIPAEQCLDGRHLGLKSHKRSCLRTVR